MTKDIPKETKESDNKSETSTETLSPTGISAMQGIESTSSENEQRSTIAENETTQIQLSQADQKLQQEWERTHDPSNWRYEFGSPHAEYEAYKDMQKAQRQHEIGQQAATADSLSDAIDTTLKARKESTSDEETPMDEYFYEKYGRHPYTTDAYPKNEDSEEDA